MKPFIHEDFLLHNETARDLYHSFAANPAKSFVAPVL